MGIWRVCNGLVGGRVCTGWVGQHVIVVCRWEDLYCLGWSACNGMEMNIYFYICVGKNPYPQDVP